MTLEVDVDNQLYAGSSVVKVTVRDSDPLTKGLGFSSQFGAREEAAFVELPEGKVLFALLDGGPPDSGPQTNAINIFKDQLPRRGDERFAIVAKSRFRKDIPRSHYPLLVTFTGITDPTTVKVVDPDNLAATFGPGVSLKRITLEITDEPVTEGKIEHVLGWLDDPTVMKNPGWKSLPYDARVAINGLFKGKLIVSEKEQPQRI